MNRYPVLFNKTLVIGIIILFFGMSVSPSTGTIFDKEISIPISSSNTLYVGGSGPDNYSTIQEAIENASDGSIVFVFDDSSPYFENLIVDKVITLIGENRETTIIDGNQNGNVVYVTIDGVTINGFTIANGKDGYLFAGVDIYANYTTISNNIIRNNYIGIALWDNDAPSYDIFLYGNVISDNLIISNSFEGIWLHFCKDSIVKNNIFSNNSYSSIHMYSASNNIILGNEISNNIYGLSLYDDSNNNDVSSNNFVSNEKYCILILDSGKNNISQNNFIESGRRHVKLFYYIWTLKRNKWNGNYWGISKEQPHIIIGSISIRRPGFVGIGIIPSINFDWNPAKEPYDIKI